LLGKSKKHQRVQPDASPPKKLPKTTPGKAASQPSPRLAPKVSPTTIGQQNPKTILKTENSGDHNRRKNKKATNVCFPKMGSQQQKLRRKRAAEGQTNFPEDVPPFLLSLWGTTRRLPPTPCQNHKNAKTQYTVKIL
jgi:hypothetical protein